MKVDYEVALEVACHEAIVRQAYKDSKGVWTWSIGLTSKTGHDVERYIGKPQPLEHCLAIYAWALEKYAQDVREAFAGRQLTKPQFAAALSFHFNTGAIKRATWVKTWLAGDVAQAAREFMQWSKPPEIITRRMKERDLFFYGKWASRGTITEYTRVRPSGIPDWSSATRINIEQELRAALKQRAPDQPPPPDIEPVAEKRGFWAWFKSVFGKGF